MHKRKLDSLSSCRIVRVGNEVHKLTEPIELATIGEDFKLLAALNYESSDLQPGVFSLIPGDTFGSEPMWLVVRSLISPSGQKGHVLSEGDVIKLGRVKFTVKEVKSYEEDQACESVHTADSSDAEEINDEIPEEREYRMCRICLCDTSDRENPLVSPCSCAGTMKYIHLSCLQQWIASRMTSRYSENSISYYWKSTDCELCKHTFPANLNFSGKNFELFRIEKPESPFIILEANSRDRTGNRGVHVINMTNKTNIRLGRGHDSDVRISDISVSRCHAVIRFMKGQFILEDNTSKFGTLVQVKKPISLDCESAISVQIGRTVMKLAVRKPSHGVLMGSLDTDELNTSDDEEPKLTSLQKLHSSVI